METTNCFETTEWYIFVSSLWHIDPVIITDFEDVILELEIYNEDD